MVLQERVTRLLQPWLGAAFLQRCELAQRAADTLNGCDIAQTPIALLAKDLDEMIFHTLRDMTCGDMRVLLDDGRTMRVRVDDVDAMADEVLYLKLQQLPRNPEQYQRLRQFAMTHESLAALRTLYLRFASFQTPDELDFIARTVRSAYSPYRWHEWLQ